MFTTALIVTLVVLGLWLWAVKRGQGNRDLSDNPLDTVTDIKTDERRGRVWIISGGLVLPLVSITALLAVGIPIGHSMLPLGEPALRVDITGHQWWWEVHYPEADLALVDELHIPAGVPVDLHLTSADVIHAFWVPRLGGKLDLVPGHVNVLRLEADEPGEYRGVCAEFCGLNHSRMHITVIAHSAEDFSQWFEEQRSHD